MAKALIVSGHPDLAHDSVANKQIIEDLRGLIPNAEFDLLDELYPDFAIDGDAERAKLERADIIVLQFPLFWYSLPSLLERWMEQTFVHGWSHGSTGKALQGKKLIVSVTVGAPEEVYAGKPVEGFLAATEATCALTGMEHAGYVVTYGVSYGLRSEAGNVEIREKASAHAKRVAEKVQGL